MIGLLGIEQKSPRRSSITNIAAAAVAPTIGVRNNTTTNPSVTTNVSSGNGKRTTDEPGNKPSLPRLMFNKDKVQQKRVTFSLTSPTVSHKGASVTIAPSYSNACDGDPGNVNNTLVNKNYITSSNPNTTGASITRTHGLTATQLTGVKNWWLTQLECVSSDEEW